MIKVDTTGNVPIKMWLDDIEDVALDQARNLSNLPFVHKHIALMPDCHMGYGMPIGGVMATKNVIVPNAVGVDIGCGMCAVKTSLTDISKEDLKKVMSEIRKVIPVGFKKHEEECDIELMPKTNYNHAVVTKEFSNARKSLGTLGGGNHFIEIQKGSDGYIWIMIHSGSRNLGLKVANNYNKLAEELNERWYSHQAKELAFLPVYSDIGKNYVIEMNYCVEFALANRKLMMTRVLEVFEQVLGVESNIEDMINIAHNYAQLENHFGKNVWVHRKGATSAKEGEIGIIPGSQGTKSYIVRGLGNKDSFNSCSHGAGRTMGRNEAKKKLSLEEEIKKLDDLGVIHSIRNKGDLDEATSCYKDIERVMGNQEDLVEIVTELTPLAVIKG